MTTTSTRTRIAATMAGALLASVLWHPAPAAAITTTTPITARVNLVGSAQAPKGTIYRPYVDSTGRYVLFDSADPLVAADTNGKRDVYRRDRLTNRTVRVSLTDAEGQFAGHNALCGASRNGRYVLFRSPKEPGSLSPELYRRDVVAETTTKVSTSSVGFGLHPDEPCAISDDGNTVAWVGQTNSFGAVDPSHWEVWVRKLDVDLVLLASDGIGPAYANANSSSPAISANGAVVAFDSEASNLVAADTDTERDVYAYDVISTSLSVVSATASGGASNGGSQQPSVSTTGRYVAFSSGATNLVADDENDTLDVFRKDRQTGAVIRASVSSAGIEGNGFSVGPNLSSDGRYVSFLSEASNLYPADVNSTKDVFRRDLQTGKTDLASRRWTGIATGNKGSGASSISTDGRVVAYNSDATDLVPGDTNAAGDIFVRDFALDHAPFASLKAFAAQQLRDFAPPGVTPAPPTIDAAAQRLATGERSPDGFIVDQARGEAWAAKRGPLVRLYWAFFLRAPDLGGMTYWTGQLTGGKTLAAVAAQFAKSSEFQTKYGSKTDQQFVTLIYQNIFERDPDPGGLAYWTNKLATGQKTRGDVMVSFSESSEGKRDLAPQADTVLITLGMVRTMPSKATLLDQKAKREAGGVAEQYAALLRTHPAYAARITP
jgi:hypothetical protein